LIPLPKDHPKSMRWQWHGAGINKEETAIYCIPSNARKVLKVDVVTKSTSFIEIEYDEMKYPEFTLDVTNKWYGKYILRLFFSYISFQPLRLNCRIWSIHFRLLIVSSLFYRQPTRWNCGRRQCNLWYSLSSMRGS
jgi:hypothetical protein